MPLRGLHLWFTLHTQYNNVLEKEQREITASYLRLLRRALRSGLIVFN